MLWIEGIFLGLFGIFIIVFTVSTWVIFPPNYTNMTRDADPHKAKIYPLETILDTTKDQLINANLQLSEANMIDKRILLNKKEAKITALEIALEYSTAELANANLQLAKANMATQRQITINIMFEKFAKKRVKSVDDLIAQAKAIKAGMEVTQDQKRTLSVENAELRNIITTKSRDLDIANERLQTLIVSNDDLINEVASLKTNIHHLCASIRTKDANGFDLAIQIQDNANQLHTMKQQLADHDQYIDELQRLLSNKDVQLQAWQANTAGSIRAFTQQISELLGEKQALQQENEELARHLEQLIGSCGVDAARELEVRFEGIESNLWATSSCDAEVEGEQSEDGTDDEESRNEIGTGEDVTSEAVSEDNGAILLSEYEDMQAIEGIEV